MSVTTGFWDGRADGEGGESAWRVRRVRRDGVIVDTEAGLRQVGDDRANRDGGAGGSGAGDHEESSKAGVEPTTGRSRTVGTRATMAIVPV